MPEIARNLPAEAANIDRSALELHWEFLIDFNMATFRSESTLVIGPFQLQFSWFSEAFQMVGIVN